MTEKEQIQNQIQELQEKLKKLEEVETEKMEFKDEGRFHFFHYNGKPYQRLEYEEVEYAHEVDKDKEKVPAIILK